ncbi:MAG TPA: hypothetical protein VND54_00735 [Candidatus Saccharimonadales bacterium]|nr:hypothetical protein [Candidatus Saccharimonadales bacterium]
MTLSNRRKRSSCVSERNLVVDRVVPLTRGVSLHGGAAIQHRTRNLRVNWKHVEARIPFRPAADQCVNDGTGMDRWWKACGGEDDLEFVADPDNSSAADSRSCRTDDGIDKEFGDVVTIGDGYGKPETWRRPQGGEQRSLRIVITGLERSRQPRSATEPWNAVGGRKPR